MKIHLWLRPAFILIILTACSNSGERDYYTAVVEGTVVQVPALTGGKIDEMAVETGDEVAAGALLAHIDTLELSYQRNQLRATLEELAVQLAIARKQLAQGETNRGYLAEKQQRIATLYEQNSASRQSLDDLTNQLSGAKTAVATAREQLATIAAREKQVQAQLALVTKKIHDATVLAPVGGMVSEKYYEPGEAIPPMSPLLEITDLARVEMKIYLTAPHLAEIKHGQQVSISVDGLDKTIDGEIIWISNTAEFTPESILTPETRTSLVYAVKIAADNPERVLKHGMPVEVRL